VKQKQGVLQDGATSEAIREPSCLDNMLMRTGAILKVSDKSLFNNYPRAYSSGLAGGNRPPTS
jgi:hypothetical protein